MRGILLEGQVRFGGRGLQTFPKESDRRVRSSGTPLECPRFTSIRDVSQTSQMRKYRPFVENLPNRSTRP
jgi:hypothetical protein